MNYNHKFHAGNFADVVKHILLVNSIEYYKIKDKPTIFFDSHAGFGIYDLNSPESLRSGECEFGIKKIFNELFDISPKYCEIINQINNANEIRYYPGSSYLIASLVREQDRAIFSDLNFNACEELKKLNFRNCIIHHRDGFEALKALLPTHEKRGVIIIDPAFEVKSDYDKIYESVRHLIKSFGNANYIIWYPLKDDSPDITSNLARLCGDYNKKHIFVNIFQLDTDFKFNMNNCGLFIINPVYGLEEIIKNLSEKLVKYNFKIEYNLI